MLLKASVVYAKKFFFVAYRIGLETSQKLPNESPPQLFQPAPDLFILTDSDLHSFWKHPVANFYENKC